MFFSLLLKARVDFKLKINNTFPTFVFNIEVKDETLIGFKLIIYYKINFNISL